MILVEKPLVCHCSLQWTLSTFIYMYSVYYVEAVFSYPYVFSAFYHKRVLNFVNAFFLHSLKWLCDFYSSVLLVWFITLTDSCMLNCPCTPGKNPTWSWFMILFICCWNWFAKLLFRNCAPISSGISVCSSHVVFLFVFGVRIMLTLWNWVWKCYHLFSYLGGFEKDRHSFFSCLVEFTSGAITFWVFLCWEIFCYQFNLY